MAALIAFLWDKTPGYVKWPMGMMFFLFLVPLKIRDEMTGFVHKEVHAVIAPMKDKRDAQILHMEEKINTIAKDTSEIKLILMQRK
jgi:hypothetical protein